MQLTCKDFKIGDRVSVKHLGFGTIIQKNRPNGTKGFINILLDEPIILGGNSYNKYWAFTSNIEKIESVS